MHGQWRSYTRDCAHIKFTGPQVKIMWKATVNNQVLHVGSQVSCGHEGSIQVGLNEFAAKNGFRSDFRVHNLKFFHGRSISKQGA